MYIKTIFNEMKSQVSTIHGIVKSVNADIISERIKKGDDNLILTSGSVYSNLPSDSIYKIERLGSLIGLNIHNMILFLGVYDFKYYITLVK